MSLQFISGNSGAGKSYMLYQHILREADRHPEKTYLVIVPEQFTMQTQKELVALSPEHAIINIDILSFQRLALRIFQEVGGKRPPVLEEIGKMLVLQRVIQEQEKSLGILAGSLKKTGTVNEMKSLISELMQYDISPAKLEELRQESEKDTLFSRKLEDVQLIYESFRRYLQDRYITGEEVLDVLCDCIQDSRLIRNCEIVLDGFTGFTPVQKKLMRKLLRLADKVWVTVTMDEHMPRERMKSPQNLFHMSGRMIEGLAEIAKEEGVEIAPEFVVSAGEHSRFAEAGALAFLERHLFRYGNFTYEKEQGEIQIFEADNPRSEMEEIARRIHYLVRTKGYSYGDFAVITGDLSTYGSYGRQVLEAFAIPYFIDEKHSILMNPFVEYLRAALGMLTDHFSYESVFRYLRCGLSGLSIEEIDEMENYCVALGIRGYKQWTEHWVRRYRGIDEGKVEEINHIREKFMDEVGEFCEKMRKKDLTMEDRTRILYDLICRTRIEERLNEKVSFFEMQGKQALMKEYSQIYGIIMELLDKMVRILGDETIGLEAYQELLEAGFQEARVGIIPPTADQVLVGDMERTRLKDIKVLFFAGVNDTCIPKRGGGGGLLSETEREYLESQNVELAPTSRETMYIQRFYLYLNLTKPGHMLCLSYARANGQGQSQGPAYLISIIGKMFPGIRIQEASDQGIREAEHPGQAAQMFLKGLHEKKEPDDAWKELFSWYLRSPQWEAICRRWVDGAFGQEPEDTIGKSVARALYGTELSGSATRLERFAACAFAHFLQYGLEIRERQEYEFRPVDLGNVIHQALEQFAGNLKKHRMSWRDLTKEQRETLIDESVEEMIHDYGNTILESSARNRYMIQRVKRILRRTVWALQEQLKSGRFEPGKFEISFAMEEELEAVNFDLSEDEKLHLRGRIDRTDRLEEADKIYVKVIDYKTGNTSMDLIALYHGLQLQLIVYMNAALEIEQREHPDKIVEPAGVFYYHVKDPLAEGSLEEEEESITQKILQELKVNGLVRAEKKIITDLDENLENGGKSSVIPVSYNKDGSLSRFSKTATKEQFESLSRYVNQKLGSLGRKILDGEVEKNPYLLRKRTACEYCDYREICGFDERLSGYGYRRLPLFHDEEIWKRIMGKEEKTDGNAVDEGAGTGHPAGK